MKLTRASTIPPHSHTQSLLASIYALPSWIHNPHTMSQLCSSFVFSLISLDLVSALALILFSLLLAMAVAPAPALALFPSSHVRYPSVSIPSSNHDTPISHCGRRSAATVASPWPTLPRGRLLLPHQQANCPGAAAATWPSTAGGTARWRTGRAGTGRSARLWRRSTRSELTSPYSSPVNRVPVYILYCFYYPESSANFYMISLKCRECSPLSAARLPCLLNFIQHCLTCAVISAASDGI